MAAIIGKTIHDYLPPIGGHKLKKKKINCSGIEGGTERRKCCKRHLSKADLRGNLFSVLFCFLPLFILLLLLLIKLIKLFSRILNCLLGLWHPQKAISWKDLGIKYKEYPFSMFFRMKDFLVSFSLVSPPSWERFLNRPNSSLI